MGFIVRPTQWEVQHAAPIFAAQSYQTAHGGLLPSTPMWRMLEFRYSLDAARFSFYHPNVGRMIQAQQTALKPPAPQIIVPPSITIVPPVIPNLPPGPPPLPPPNPSLPPDGGGTTTPPTNPQEPGGPVPEPSAFIMLGAAILVMGIGFGRFRRRSV